MAHGAPVVGLARLEVGAHVVVLGLAVELERVGDQRVVVGVVVDLDPVADLLGAVGVGVAPAQHGGRVDRGAVTGRDRLDLGAGEVGLEGDPLAADGVDPVEDQGLPAVGLAVLERGVDPVLVDRGPRQVARVVLHGPADLLHQDAGALLAAAVGVPGHGQAAAGRGVERVPFGHVAATDDLAFGGHHAVVDDRAGGVTLADEAHVEVPVEVAARVVVRGAGDLVVPNDVLARLGDVVLVADVAGQPGRGAVLLHRPAVAVGEAAVLEADALAVDPAVAGVPPVPALAEHLGDLAVLGDDEVGADPPRAAAEGVDPRSRRALDRVDHDVADPVPGSVLVVVVRVGVDPPHVGPRLVGGRCGRPQQQQSPSHPHGRAQRKHRLSRLHDLVQVLSIWG